MNRKHLTDKTGRWFDGDNAAEALNSKVDKSGRPPRMWKTAKGKHVLEERDQATGAMRLTMPSKDEVDGWYLEHGYPEKVDDLDKGKLEV